MAHGKKMIMGFFKKLADWEAAKKDTFQFNQSDLHWTKYSPPTCRRQTRKNENSLNRSSKQDRIVDGSSSHKKSSQKKKKDSNKKKQDVIADILKLLLSLK
jgi:hypothetical protein